MARAFNDVLDEIFLGEQNFKQMGFTRGFSLGEEAGWKEGYTLGLQKGAELASELGFYQGFVHAWITVLEKEDSAKQRKLRALRCLLEMTQNFPSTNVQDQDLIEKLTKIRTKFKQVVSLLNVDSELIASSMDEVPSQKPEMSF